VSDSDSTSNTPQTDGGGTGETQTPEDFEKWLAAQPDLVRASYQQHVSGLKSALDSERTQRKAIEKAEKDRKAAEDKAKDNAEAQRLAEEKRFQELADKAKERADGLEGQLREAQEKIWGFTMRRAFQAEATKQQLDFASPEAQEDAFMLADLASVEMAEDGTVKGMEDVVKALKKQKGYLFAQPRQPGGNLNANEGRGSGGGKLPEQQLRDEARRRFGIA